MSALVEIHMTSELLAKERPVQEAHAHWLRDAKSAAVWSAKRQRFQH